MNVADIDVEEHRDPDHEIEELIYHRWSPRAMTGEPVSQEDLDRLLEAARWAPSCYNDQPWRIFYAHRDTDHWQTFFDWLVEFNQGWCENAGVLFVFTSKTHFEHNGKPNSTHGFDAGSAWENLALQASAMGLVSHGMAGFDAEAAHDGLGLGDEDDEYEVHCMVAVGHPADVETLPEDLRERETPSGRKSVGEISHEGPLG